MDFKKLSRISDSVTLRQVAEHYADQVSEDLKTKGSCSKPIPPNVIRADLVPAFSDELENVLLNKYGLIVDLESTDNVMEITVTSSHYDTD